MVQPNSDLFTIAFAASLRLDKKCNEGRERLRKAKNDDARHMVVGQFTLAWLWGIVELIALNAIWTWLLDLQIAVGDLGWVSYSENGRPSSIGIKLRLLSQRATLHVCLEGSAGSHGRVDERDAAYDVFSDASRARPADGSCQRRAKRQRFPTDRG